MLARGVSSPSSLRPGGGLHHDLIHVAPGPVLAGLEAPYDGMVRSVEVLRRMLSGRGIATPDMSTRETKPKVNPPPVRLETLLATLGRSRLYISYLVQMCAMQGHRCSSLVMWNRSEPPLMSPMPRREARAHFGGWLYRVMACRGGAVPPGYRLSALHQFGSANTHSTDPPSGFWISGVSVASERD
jgi:hypothetical protein